MVQTWIQPNTTTRKATSNILVRDEAKPHLYDHVRSQTSVNIGLVSIASSQLHLGTAAVANSRVFCFVAVRANQRQRIRLHEATRMDDTATVVCT